MSGALAVTQLLTDAPALANRDPAASIALGRADTGAGLSLLLVRTVSSVERQPLKRAGWVRRTERVSVAIRAASYREQKALLEIVNAVCVGPKGDVLSTARNVSILSAGVGPDVDGPGDSFEQTHDFRVSFDAPVTTAQPGA